MKSFIIYMKSFTEHLWETAISCPSCRISTTKYSKKTTSQVLFKHFVQDREVAIRRCLLKTPESCEEVNL